MTQNDYPYGLGLYRTTIDTFKIGASPVRVLPYVGEQLYFHAAVTFEHASSIIKIDRIDYGMFQWAADIGGLYNLFSKLFMFLLSFLVAGGAHMFVGLQLMTRSADYHKNRVLLR